jgi:DNA-binding MarR family transcriptional regulator
MTAKKSREAPATGKAIKAKVATVTPADALQKLRIVVRAAQRHSTWIEKQCGVTGAQLWLMQELYETPGLRVGELAERLAIHQTTTSNMLNGLVRRKLLVKKRDSADQRVVTLVLTKEGAAVVAKAPKPARGLLPEALRGMEQKRLRELTRGLQALLDEIGNADEGMGKQPLPFNM